MIVIAHAGHVALSLLQLAPVVAVAAFAAWRSVGAHAAPPGTEGRGRARTTGARDAGVGRQ